jgi:hypothetical protein
MENLRTRTSACVVQRRVDRYVRIRGWNQPNGWTWMRPAIWDAPSRFAAPVASQAR